jgi:hypothetical protein
MSNVLIFAQWYATIQGHFVDLHATRFTNFYVIVNNMAIAMPQSTLAPPGGDNCSWRTLLLHWTLGSVMTLIQGHWSKVKVTLHIMVKT